MSDYVDTVDIEGVQYDIQDTATKETAEQNTEDIQGLEPVDIVQLGNMKPATSNAVATAINNISSVKAIRQRYVATQGTAKTVGANAAFSYSITTPSFSAGWYGMSILLLSFAGSNAAQQAPTAVNNVPQNTPVTVYGVNVGAQETVNGCVWQITEYQ